MLDTDEVLKQDLEAVFRRIKAAGYREGQQAAVRDILQLVQSKFSVAPGGDSDAKPSPSSAPIAESAFPQAQANGGTPPDGVQVARPTAATPLMLNEEVAVTAPRSKSLVLTLVGICAFLAVGMTALLKFPNLIPL